MSKPRDYAGLIYFECEMAKLRNGALLQVLLCDVAPAAVAKLKKKAWDVSGLRIKEIDAILYRYFAIPVPKVHPRQGLTPLIICYVIIGP